MIRQVSISNNYMEPHKIDWQKLRLNEIGSNPANNVGVDTFNSSTGSGAISNPGTDPDLALQDLKLLAEGRGREVLDQRLYGFNSRRQDTTDFNPITNHLGIGQAGVPGGFPIDDTAASARDAQFSQQLAETRIQSLLYLISLIELGPESIAGLLERQGVPREQALSQATELLNEIVRKSPDFVASAQRAIRQTRTLIDGETTRIESVQARNNDLTQRAGRAATEAFQGGR